MSKLTFLLIFYFPKKKAKKQSEILVIPAPPSMLAEEEEEEEEEDPTAKATLEALSNIDFNCPICKPPLNVGSTKEKGTFYCMCSSGDCNLGWQRSAADYAKYLLDIKEKVNAEFKYPRSRVRCDDHGKTATLVRCYSKVDFIDESLFYVCANKKDEGGKCEFVKAAQFASNSKNALNAEAWYKLEAKRQVRSNKEAKAGLAYHFQELNASKQKAKKQKKN